MLYVEHTARMNAPVLDDQGNVKSTVGEELEGLYQRNPDRRPPVPQIPESVGYLWDWWVELHSDGPVTWERIDAWARQTGQSPEPHECRALIEVDSTYRIHSRGS